MTTTLQNTLTFQGLGLSDHILNALDRLQFKSPTPIQHQSLPAAIEGKDLIGIAQTGTGKTLAFGLPMIQRLSAIQGKSLVLLPTRELALQVAQALQPFLRSYNMKTATLIGGENFGLQLRALREKPRIIIGTPGRVMDHIEQKTIRFDDTRILVLDEADRMLDMGFAPQINEILRHVPKEKQTLLFSATMPPDIVKIAANHMKIPVRIEVAPAGTTADKVEQEIIFMNRDVKVIVLESVVRQSTGPVLVFSRTKRGAKKICQTLNRLGHHAAEIHADRSLNQRKEALAGFKSGKYRILVATDIAARGIDVNNIELVVNFDLPENAEDYVHRIGRTGRAGKTGKAISFATHDQKSNVRLIERLIRKTLRIVPVPDLSNSPKIPQPSAAESREDSRRDRPQRSFSKPSSGGGRGRFDRFKKDGPRSRTDRPRDERSGNQSARPSTRPERSRSDRPSANPNPRTDRARQDRRQDRPQRIERPKNPGGSIKLY
ncbi:MAG: DEAD/DEAH box helicase [Deltaproteobacteria bacterium]|nr:MAG: DEAD/DEAH box helicase [Deltaproteobacteria bacterium]